MSFDNSLLKIAYLLSHRYADNFFSADELISESFLAICDVLKNFDPKRDTKITTYAYTIISRRIFKYKKKNMKHYINHNSIYKSRADDEALLLDLPCPHAENLLNRYFNYDILHEIRSFLKAEEFRVLDLRYGITCEAKTLIESAEILGINRETLRRKQKKIEEKIYLKFGSELESSDFLKVS